MSNKPLSVLLIDDDETTRNIFRMVLDHYQYSLTTMNDGESALAYLEQQNRQRNPSPDVIVIDIFLPGKNGYEMLDQIKGSEFGKAPRFIATTSYYTTDTADQLMKHGFNGILFKPLDAQHIVPYLDEVAHQKAL
ncbi:MAG TPA: response regulator [Aggregatilineales bacterium]|nr:response regulator [Aggregatilineales bacterium]